MLGFNRLVSKTHAQHPAVGVCLCKPSLGRLSDGLVCSNGIISAKLAGKLRYLDST